MTQSSRGRGCIFAAAGFATAILLALVLGVVVLRTMFKAQPLQVPAGAFFVLGDNRDNANDSRYIGFVKRDDIRGRVVLVISRTKGVRRP